MIIDNINNRSYEVVIGFFETILLNDLGSHIILLDKLDGELILSCRLVNVGEDFLSWGLG